MRLLFFSLFSLFLTLGLGAEEPLMVHLQTEDVLMPVVVLPVASEESGFGADHVQKLMEVLQFDLNSNGMTRVVSGQKSSLALSDVQGWREREIFYVVAPMIKGNALNAQVLSVYSNRLQEVEGLHLRGDLKVDRSQVHRLSDAIYRALFGEEGIASSHLLYTVRVHDQEDWFSEVWQADYDGVAPRQVTRSGSYCVTPSYLPPERGKRSGSFFYVCYKLGQPKIYVASLKDGIGRRVIQLHGNQLMPVATERRDRIAFISDVTGNPDLFLQEFSPSTGALGMPRQIFSASHATQGSPTFSPDGDRLAFVSNKDGSARIYVMQIPAEGVPLKKIQTQLISKYQRGSTAPAWSPDGTKIAYCARHEGVRQIFVHDLLRQEDRQLTTGPGNKENPTWAPNSLVLAYNTTDAHNSDLYLVTLKQPRSIKISQGPGEKHFPAWERY